jgi:hypothetical protein
LCLRRRSSPKDKQKNANAKDDLRPAQTREFVIPLHLDFLAGIAASPADSLLES